MLRGDFANKSYTAKNYTLQFFDVDGNLITTQTTLALDLKQARERAFKILNNLDNADYFQVTESEK